MRATGKVKWYNLSKGYGFITPDEGGKDIFVHATALNGQTLQENDRVEFDIENTKKGSQAIDVVLI